MWKFGLILYAGFDLPSNFMSSNFFTGYKCKDERDDRYEGENFQDVEKDVIFICPSRVIW